MNAMLPFPDLSPEIFYDVDGVNVFFKILLCQGHVVTSLDPGIHMRRHINTWVHLP